MYLNFEFEKERPNSTTRSNTFAGSVPRMRSHSPGTSTKRQRVRVKSVLKPRKLYQNPSVSIQIVSIRVARRAKILYRAFVSTDIRVILVKPNSKHSSRRRSGAESVESGKHRRRTRGPCGTRTAHAQP